MTDQKIARDRRVAEDSQSPGTDEERNFVQNGDYASGLLRRQADAIFFVNEVHVVGQS